MKKATDVIFSDTVNNETVNGETVSLEHLGVFSVQAVWTGASANGTIKLQGTINGTTWADIDGTEVTISGAGDQLWDQTQLTGIPFIRVSVTSADTNDIVVTAHFYAKG